MLALELLRKAPYDEVDVTMSFDRSLAEGETLSAPAVAATGITVASAEVAAGGRSVKARASGGTDGVTYTITFTVETSLGQKLKGCGLIKVEDC